MSQSFGATSPSVRSPSLLDHLRCLQSLTIYQSGHVTPTSYTGATYTLLKNGNRVNGTHWQFTAKCSGCTTWTGASGSARISPTGSSRLAFAYSSSKASNPSSNTSSIPVHDTPNYWTHDFSTGLNANFETLLARNGVS